MASPGSRLTFSAEHVPDHVRQVKALLLLLERHAQRAPAAAPTPPRETPNGG